MSIGSREISSERALVLALLATGMVLFLGWRLYADYYARHVAVFPAPSSETLFLKHYGINSYLLQAFGFPNIRGQARAYQTMLASIVLLAAGLAWKRQVICSGLPGWAWGVCRGTVLAGMAALTVLAWKQQSLPLWIGAVGISLCVACWFLRRSLVDSRWNPSVLAVLVFLALALQGPALLMKVDRSHESWAIIESHEVHYVILLSQGDRLAAGFRLWDEVWTPYGVLMPVLTAIYQRAAGEISLHGYSILLNALQAAYLAAAAYGYYRYGRRKWIYACLPLLLMALHYHFYSFAMTGAPNHSAWRQGGFPLAILTMIVLRHMAFRRAVLWAGMTGGLALLLNPETGVAVNAGLLLFLYCHWPVRGVIHLARMGGWFALGLTTVVILFLAAVRVFLGPLPTWHAITTCFYFQQLASQSGFTGGVGTPHPLAVLIFAHATACLLQISLRGRRGPHFFTALRAGVCGMILVWFAYYANRPHYDYMTSYLILYGFLLVDVQRVLLLSRGAAVSRWTWVASAVIVAVLILPHIKATWDLQKPVYLRGIALIRHGPVASEATAISGVYFPKDARESTIEEKSQFLRRVAGEGPVVYFSVDAYLLAKHSGVWPAIPMTDAFLESPSRERYQAMLASVVRPATKAIYFDDQDSIPLLPAANSTDPPVISLSLANRGFYRQLRQDLAPYFQKRASDHGWEHWVRRPERRVVPEP
jgi:hypothetical protein